MITRLICSVGHGAMGILVTLLKLEQFSMCYDLWAIDNHDYSENIFYSLNEAAVKGWYF